MGVPWETVTFTALGRNRQMFYDMLEEGQFLLVLDAFKDLQCRSYTMIYFSCYQPESSP